MNLALLLLLQPLADRGFQQFANGDFAAARKTLEQAVAQQPRSFQSRFLLGATLVELKEPAAAITHLRQAHLLNPQHADVRKLLAAQYAATRQFAKAIPLVSPPSDEETHLLLIESLQGAGDSTRAFALARQAAERFPKSAQIAAWLGFQLQFAGRYDEAKPQLRKAVDLDASLALPYQVMGDLLLKEESYAEAVQWLRQAGERAPGDSEILLSLARALAGSGETGQAIEVLRQAPRDAKVHLLLSRLYFQAGDEARARREAELSIQLRERSR